MRKIYLFMLMAAGLLVSGNVGANVPAMPKAEKTPVIEPMPYQCAPASMSKAHVRRATKEELPQIEENQQKIAVSFGTTKDTVNTLANAFALIPETNVPATVKLLTDVFLQFESGSYINVNTPYQNIILDLNGHTVYSKQNLPANSQVIKIGKNAQLTIDDSSEDKNGKITNFSSQPDMDWGGEGKKQYPTYGNYTITNDGGTLILNNGTIENTTGGGGALYAIHCTNASANANIIINGGSVTQVGGSDPIRLWGGSNTNEINFEMNGGKVEGGRCIFNQYLTNLNITINNGELIPRPNMKQVLSTWESNNNKSKSNTNITVNGGKLGGEINIYGGNTTTRTNIVFHGGEIDCSRNSTPVYSTGEENVMIDGGMFLNFNTDYPLYKCLDWFYAEDGCYTYLKGTSGYEFYTEDQVKDELASYQVKDYHDYQSSQDPGEFWAIFDKNNQFLGWEYQFKDETIDIFKEKRLAVVDYFYINAAYDFGDLWATASITNYVNKQYEFQNDQNNWILPGYAAVPYNGYNSPGTDLIIGTIQQGESQEGTNDDYDDDTKNTTGWHQTTTWNDEVVPDELTTVKIAEKAKVVVEEGTNASAYQIILADSAKLIVEEGATITVGAGGIQRMGDITGGENADTTTIIVQAGGTMVATSLPEKNTGIYVHGDAQNAGILLFDPSATETQKLAHVELATYCKKVGDQNFWQMIAIPVEAANGDYTVTSNGNEFELNPNHQKFGTWLYEWNYNPTNPGWEFVSGWQNATKNFVGYDMSNTSLNGGVTYTFHGTLIGNQNIDFVLPEAGYAILGNSYTAPLDVLKLFEQVDKDVNHTGNENSRIEEAIYVYNSKLGYYECTTRFQQELHQLMGNAYPISFTAIPPMQGFLMNLMGGSGSSAGISVNYAQAIFGGAHVTKPAYAPARSTSIDYILADINVSAANANDHVMLVEGNEFSAEFENGKDAYKYMNEDGINMYILNNDAKYAAFATDNLEGTFIAFQSNDQAEYTLSFTNCFNNDYVLVDLENSQCVPMKDAQTYTFNATPNTLNPSRFMVVSPRTMPTGMEQIKGMKNVKGIYTMLGQYVGKAEEWNNIRSGAYIVNGQKLMK